MIKQLRLAIFIWIIGIALKILPKDCIKTLKWIQQIPWEQ